MRAYIIAAVTLVVMGSAPAMARDYPWCQRSRASGGEPQCSFTSYRQCQATVSGLGGICVRNPRFGVRGGRY